MRNVKVGNWTFNGENWHRGTYVVKRNGSGFVAQMKMGTRYVTLGTSGESALLPTFLTKVDNFVHLKEEVYA